MLCDELLTKEGEFRMAIFRVTWEGYYDTDASDEEEARKKFMRYVEEEDIDQYGRDWKDLIEIEELTI